jgi:hypothetical protein
MRMYLCCFPSETRISAAGCDQRPVSDIQSFDARLKVFFFFWQLSERDLGDSAEQRRVAWAWSRSGKGSGGQFRRVIIDRHVFLGNFLPGSYDFESIFFCWLLMRQFYVLLLWVLNLVPQPRGKNTDASSVCCPLESNNASSCTRFAGTSQKKGPISKMAVMSYSETSIALSIYMTRWCQLRSQSVCTQCPEGLKSYMWHVDPLPSKSCVNRRQYNSRC